MVSHPVEDISDNNMSTCPGPGTTGKMGSEDTQKDDRPKCFSPEFISKIASVFCEVCGFICTECEEVHRSVGVLRKHKMLSLAEATKKKLDKLLRCSEHGGQLLQLYCDQCKIAMCLLCYPLYHAHHPYVELVTEADTYRSQLVDMMEDTKVKRQSMSDSVLKVQEQSSKLEKDVTEAKRSVSDAFKKIYDDLKIQEHVFYLQIDETYQQEYKQLNAHRERVELSQAILDSVLSCGENLLTGGRPDDYLCTVPLLLTHITANTQDLGLMSERRVDFTDIKYKAENMKVYLSKKPII